MREILFRGKRTDNGEWVQGDLLNHDNRVGIHNQQGDGTMNVIDVDPETVGQYTGLKDSTGKQIFEGDILKIIAVDTGDDLFCEVRFGEFVDNNDSQHYLGFYVKDKEIIVSILNGKDDGYNLTEFCEVFGNIHDNPELSEEI